MIGKVYENEPSACMIDLMKQKRTHKNNQMPLLNVAV
jgi:hypothetical protein